MSEHTPTTEEVREQFAVNIARFGPGFGSEEVGREGFDRWLAQHDREVAARIDAVRALHEMARESEDRPPFCINDGWPWPCPTIRALGGDS